MLEDTVGEQAIQEGIHHYLDMYQFDNAITNDLWWAIEDKWTHTPEQQLYNFTVQEMMDTWTLQMGYPLVTFARKNDSENRYRISQERFFKANAVNDTEINKRKAEQNYQWLVPVSFDTNLEDLPTKYLVLNKSKSKICF